MSTQLGKPSTNGDRTPPGVHYKKVRQIRPNTFVQIMCIQPPLLSVGVLQPGQGLLVTLMVNELGSAPFHLAPKALGSVGSKLQRIMLSPIEGTSNIEPGVFWALSGCPTSKETFSYMSPLQAVPEKYGTKYNPPSGTCRRHSHRLHKAPSCNRLLLPPA